MAKITINLSTYKTVGSKVFTGRDRGKEVRENSKIDVIDTNSNEVEITIPEEIRSINPSFLEEFLVNVVTRLGATEFKNKFKFINQGRYKIDSDLEEAIERILRQENALS